MKLLICGVPLNKMAQVPSLFPEVDVRCIGCKEPMRIWQQRVKPADICVVLTNLTSHKHMEVVRNVFGRNVVSAHGYNNAIAAAAELTKPH